MWEWVMLVTLSILWGGSFFFNGLAVRELPTFTVVLCRVLLAAVTLLLAMRLMGLPMPKGYRIWQTFFIMGAINNVVPFVLIVWGQLHIASGVAAILNATTPLLTVIVAHYLTEDEKITASKIIGIIVGFGGIVIMIGWEVGKFGIGTIAQLAVLGAALSYAFAGVFGRRFKIVHTTPIAAAAGQVTASSIILFPIVMLIDGPWGLSMPGFTTLGAITGLAVLSTALAYMIYFRILATSGATNISLVTFLVPVSAILLGGIFLDESLLLQHFIGIFFIGLGLSIIDGRLWKLLAAFHAPKPEE
jgi:drug/metabolite transporter (DMT)-like permease